MESRLYLCPRCGKGVKFTNGLTKHVNACKIPITLPNRQSSKPIAILKNNMTNISDLPSDNNQKSISPGVLNHGKAGIRLANNNDEDIKPANIYQLRPTTPNWTPQNKLISELSRKFREVTLSKSEFLVGTPVLDTRYEHFGTQNNNPIYTFNNQIAYVLANYFAELETTKCNVDKFISNLLMKPNTEKL